VEEKRCSVTAVFFGNWRKEIFMGMQEDLRALIERYEHHPSQFHLPFLDGVVWPEALEIDSTVPQPSLLRGRPGEEGDWPFLFWQELWGRLQECQAAATWSAGQSAQEVVLGWISVMIQEGQRLAGAWAEQSALERQTWGVPDLDAYPALQAQLGTWLQRLSNAAEQVRQGDFQVREARLRVWRSHMAMKRLARRSQPSQQLVDWSAQVEKVLQKVM
jgi:hypothetical protein